MKMMQVFRLMKERRRGGAEAEAELDLRPRLRQSQKFAIIKLHFVAVAAAISTAKGTARGGIEYDKMIFDKMSTTSRYPVKGCKLMPKQQQLINISNCIKHFATLAFGIQFNIRTTHAYPVNFVSAKILAKALKCTTN